MSFSKKGEISLMYIFELVAVMFIIFLVFDAAWEFSQGKTTGKIILAKDMNYMAEAFLTVPGDSFAVYYKNITDYEVTLDRSGFKVKERNDSTDEGFVSTFILPEGYDAVGLANSVHACLIKKGKTIFLKNCEDVVNDISEIIS